MLSSTTMVSALWLCFVAAILQASFAAKRSYIVQMKHHQKPTSYLTHHQWYSDHLQSLTSATPDAMFYTYTTAYHGFAASLDSQQVEALRESDFVLGVYEDTMYQLHTTRTPEFLGIEKESGLWSSHQHLDNVTSDVIIGVLDTGVWPEHKSFDDSGMSDVPARWIGECEEAEDFTETLCNKKLIGARMFNFGYRMSAEGRIIVKETMSPRDFHGHGTHTATTAAGAQVGNASLFGYASGTARGIAVHARVAAYKICWEFGCSGSDILAAMDTAISDGVDILSLSIGAKSVDYYDDPVAVGAFNAIQKGLFVSGSAGNLGPERSKISNVAPWIMTVGAGTIDRNFPADVILGNGKKVNGVSLYSGKGLGDKPVELVYDGGKRNDSTANFCFVNSLDPELVRGKIVLCDRGLNPRYEKGMAVMDAGGIGMILANNEVSGEEVIAESDLLATVAVGRKEGDEIKAYLKSKGKRTALLRFYGTVLGVKPSPMVAGFSSRGPNNVTPQILKPDVIGPGVNILAGWSGALGPTAAQTDTRRTPYNILSGTSMSCPVISGLAALLKAAHPDWSPSAIKSALMTTAYTVDNTNSTLRDEAGGEISTPWAYGAGHVDPRKAISPGLVYDISPQEYVTLVCSLGYTLKQVEAIVNRPNITCDTRFRDPGQVNYPSFSVVFGKSRVVRYTRRLTNVGAAASVFDVAVEAPTGVEVIVKPERLVYKKVGERLRYTVTFVSKKGAYNKRNVDSDVFGSITWKNSVNQVRSPVAFSWEKSV